MKTLILKAPRIFLDFSSRPIHVTVFNEEFQRKTSGYIVKKEEKVIEVELGVIKSEEEK